MENKKAQCSFCGKEEKDSELVITNETEDSYICIDCIRTIYKITKEESKEETEMDSEDMQILKPKELKKILDEHIVGQTKTKEKISVSVYNHLKRILHSKNLEVNLQKSNILLIGPSGSGKTLIVESLSKALNIPFVTADATSLTEAGYVGEDVQSMLVKLLDKTDWDVEKAEQGIIFIDEIDKIAKKIVAGRQSSRDIAGEGVQQALLKIIEGAEVKVEQNGKTGQGKMVNIDTNNILFIVAGAFEGLEEIISQRHNLNKKVMGFNEAEQMTEAEKLEFRNQIFHKVTTEDLIAFGLIPELLGRIPSVGVLDKLSVDQMVDILTKPKNSLTKQFKELFALDNINLKFQRNALLEIVRIAEERKIGARGLRSVMEEILENIMYNIDEHENKTVVVTQKMVLEKVRGGKKNEKNN